MTNKKLSGTEKKMMIVFVVMSCIAIIAVILIKMFVPATVESSEIQQQIPDDVKQILSEMAPTDSRIQYIYDNIDQYSPQVLTYFVTRLDTESVIDFVYDYPQKHELDEPVVFTDEELKSSLPLLFQYDERWGYKYMGGVENGEMIAEAGCLCCCLNMVYMGVNHANNLNPYLISCQMYAEDMLGISGSKQTATEWFCSKYGLDCKKYVIDDTNKIDEKVFTDALDSGDYILLSVMPGKFTMVGHAILIREYKDGKYYINDPASEARSNTAYSFDEIAEDVDMFWVISDNN